jgi:alkylated DNA repair dioxygenase AlkB
MIATIGLHKDKQYKRLRKMALIAVVDYLTTLDRPAECDEIHKVLAKQGIHISIDRLQRWLDRWANDTQYTAICTVPSKPWQPPLYTVHKCDNTRSYKHIVYMAKRYIGT